MNNINMDKKLELNELEAAAGGNIFEDVWEIAKKEIPGVKEIVDLSEKGKKSVKEIKDATKLLIDHPEIVVDVIRDAV